MYDEPRSAGAKGKRQTSSLIVGGSIVCEP